SGMLVLVQIPEQLGVLAPSAERALRRLARGLDDASLAIGKVGRVIVVQWLPAANAPWLNQLHVAMVKYVNLHSASPGAGFHGRGTSAPFSDPRSRRLSCRRARCTSRCCRGRSQAPTPRSP